MSKLKEEGYLELSKNSNLIWKEEKEKGKGNPLSLLGFNFIRLQLDQSNFLEKAIKPIAILLGFWRGLTLLAENIHRKKCAPRIFWWFLRFNEP